MFPYSPVPFVERPLFLTMPQRQGVALALSYLADVLWRGSVRPPS